jgi:nitrite reductase/ring-hydroxylating ferredoxin subunit
VTILLDALEDGRDRSGIARAADASLALGLAGAAGAAVTGLTDWSDTDGAARKMGLVHGVMNVTATSLYVAALVTRNRQQRWAGRLYALLGFAVSYGAAYLGGELVYSEQVGVNHAFAQDAPSQFTPVLNERDLKDGKPVRAQAGDVAVVLVRQGNRVYAMANTCAHLGGPLSEGEVEDGAIECPWHDSKYALEDGRVLGGPTTHPQPSYECRIRGGQVEIRARRGQPAEAEADAQQRRAG